jgi:hypothetical protein
VLKQSILSCRDLDAKHEYGWRGEGRRGERREQARYLLVLRGSQRRTEED